MTIATHAAETKDRRRSSPLEVLLVFLRLGVTCFGGPIAHIGYFRDEFVVRRRWLDEQVYADLVGLCQFLPGPASSQVSPAGIGLLHGLKLVAVAIVAQAVWGMARTLCPDRERASIALVVALIILFSASSVSQIAAILLGGIAGLSLCRARTAGNDRTGYGAGLAHCGPGGARGVLSAARRPSRAAWPSKLAGVALFEAFYRSSALVFGGGHVVLPLLREAFVTPGWVSDDAFLAGYGAAQAVPGLLFTFAAYLGVVVNTSPHGLTGAALGLIGIFLPGVLILMGTLPFWESFRKRVGAQAVMRGVNAAVVGLLGAALYNPVWTSSVKTPRDFGIALVGFVLLTVWRAAPLVVVIVSALGGIALAEAM